MHKHIKIVFSLVAALLLSACSYDELPWEGIRNTEDEVAIPFATESDFEVESLTRSADSESTLSAASIDQVDLIVFSGGSFVYHKSYSRNTDFTSENTYVKAPRGQLEAGNWYLIANAGSKVSTFAAQPNDALRSEANFKQSVLANESEVLGASNPILCAMKQVNEVPAVNSTSTVFELRKLYAKIILKVSDECKNFLVKSTKFYAEDSKVALSGDPAQQLVLATKSYAPGTGNTATTTVGSESVTHLSTTGSITFYMLPMAVGMSKTESGATKYAEPRLLLHGRRISDRDAEGNILTLDQKDTYYAYQFPKAIQAGCEYTLTLESVSGQGKEEASDAFDEPVGAVVDFKEKTESNNIITDGERSIAVVDSITYNAGTAAAAESFYVYWRGKSGDAITSPLYDSSTKKFEGCDWLTNVTFVEENDIASTSEETAKGLLRKKTKVSFTVAKNEGSERQEVIPFCFANKTDVLVESVITQEAAKINIADIFTINLTIQRGTTKEPNATEYYGFMNGVIGLSPDANGGRVRNAGIHLPMPNSETGTPVTYTYTITPKNGTWVLDEQPTNLSISKSGNVWTITGKDTEYDLSPGVATYEVYKDGLQFRNTSTGVTINLDVYHTGFFSKASDGKYYYYEVFNAGGSYWLDRNVGATSAGMAHLGDSDYLSGSWPINSTSAGSYVTYKDAVASPNTFIPKGYRLPSQGDFEKLAMQRTFSSDRMQTAGGTIFVPNFRQTYNVYRDGRATPTTVAMYFPHNRYEHHTLGITGDSGAGYYLTSTGTDTDGYYRVMKFIGMNTTATTLSFGSGKTDRSASLRCVSAQGEQVDNTTFTYSCQVKGYTHVFLYHVAADGTKTFLNTWPGQEVAIGDMATLRYNPFSYTSYVSLTANSGKLFVIFNKVENGAITDSNVSSAAGNNALAKRQGIPFMQGDAYDIDKTPILNYKPSGYSSNIVTKGNWINNSSGQETIIYNYRIKGSLTGNKEDWNESLATMTKNADGSYTATVNNFGADGQFIFMQNVIVNGAEGGWTEWGKAPNKTTTVQLDKDITGLVTPTETDKMNDCNFRLTEAGNYTITLYPSADGLASKSKFRISKVGGGTVTYPNSITLKGNYINGSWDENSNWPVMTNDGNGIYKCTVNVSNTGNSGQFVLRTDNGDEYKPAGGSATDVSYDTPMSFAKSSADGVNWKFTKTGNHSITVDWAAKTLTVTYTATPTNKFVIKGKIWGNAKGEDWIYNTDDLIEENGLWCYRNVTVKTGGFGIGVFNYSETQFTDDTRKQWWGGNPKNDVTPPATIGQSKIITIFESDDNNMSVDAGTYDFIIDPSTKNLTITRKGISGTITPLVRIIGNFTNVGRSLNNWDVNAGEPFTRTDAYWHKYQFTAEKAGDIYFKISNNGTIYGPSSGSDTTVPIANLNNNSPVAEANKNGAFKVSVQKDQKYEISYHISYNGAHRVAIIKL